MKCSISISVMSISKILTEALSCLQQVCTYDFNYLDFAGACKYYDRAAVLIELVEVYDCGSIGGFGEGQRINGNGGCAKYEDKYDNLYARWRWLSEKYGYDAGRVSKEAQKEIRKFFKRK